jgi:hypothetical protein
VNEDLTYNGGKKKEKERKEISYTQLKA